MAAIIRVKRCLDEDPLNTFILQCKKRKVEPSKSSGNSEEDVIQTTVLKFAGTIQKDENILTHLKNKQLPKSDTLKATFRKHTANVTDKLRLEHQEASKNSRYKIVNFFRSASLDTPEKVSDTEKSKYEVTILDVETDVNENNPETVNQNSEVEDKYVYDLYYTSSDDFGDAEIEEYVSVYPLNDPLLVGSARDNGFDGVDSDDSEDSNAESNWRNEYPDEDDMESIHEDDMIEAMKNVELDDLSSDGGEEEHVYSLDSDEEYHDALDADDVNKYGTRYAEFKAKHKNVETTSFSNNELYCGDIDENEYYY